MPWKKKDVDRFKKGLTDRQKEQWVEIANDVLRRCKADGGNEKECEAKAIRQANGVVGNMKANSFKTCASSILRHEWWEGKYYAVAPVVALVEGVHNGFLYPLDEISKFVPAWNGVPVPVFHPEDDFGPISCNDPQIIQKQSIGRFFNAYMEDGKLKGEIWIDVEKAQRIAPEVMEYLQSGKRLEVSTALWSDHEAITGDWNGEPYEAIFRNIRPDHLALLPGGQGACSWEDGCGVRINQGGNNDMESNVKGRARTPEYKGIENISWANVTKTFAAYRDGYYKHGGEKPSDKDDIPSRIQDAPAAMKRWIASKTLLGDAGADNERDLIFFPVVNPSTNKLNEGALRAVLGGRAAQADIPEAAKESARAKARSLLNKEFDAGLETSEKSGIRHWFKGLAEALGFNIQEPSHEDIRVKLQQAIDGLDQAPVTMPALVHYVKEVYDDYFIYAQDGPDGQKLFKRGYSIDDNGQIKLKDKIDEVRQETRYVPVGNEQKNMEVNKMNKVKELVDALITNDNTRFVECDRGWLESLGEEQLTKLQPVEPKANEKKPKDEDNEKPKTNEDTHDDKPDTHEKSEHGVPTFEQFIANAPADYREMIESGVRMHKERKAELVKRLLANKRNRFTEEQLSSKSIEELDNLAVLAQVEVDYSGNAGAPSEQFKPNERKPDGTGVPDPPVPQWNK